MSNHIKTDEFVQIVIENDADPRKIISYIKENLNSEYGCNVTQIRNRISAYKRKGLLPLDSGNKIDEGTFLKKYTTEYDMDGSITRQWVTADISKEQQLLHIQEAIESLTQNLPTLPTVEHSASTVLEDDMTVYISNDLHFGMMAWEPETGQDWDINMVASEVRLAYDDLFTRSPASKVGIVVDLGDLAEADDFKNMTPHSGNILDVDSRYPKVLRMAYEALMYAVNKALQKHEIVYFYNVAGNHDPTFGHAVREIMYQAYKDNPRVIIDESPSPIKYHQHGKTLLQFFHGDQMKMARAGETMVVDCEDIFSSTKHRYGHSGHWHRDIVLDGPIAKIESHRNLPTLNAWAHGAGYRRGIGTMKSITYNLDLGEMSRVIFPVSYQR